MPAPKTVLPIALGFLCWGLSVQTAWAIDVYVVYSGRDKALATQVVSALSRDLSVKKYNADLLALADYSGKQKAVAKISRAQLIVILRDRPMNLFRGSRIRGNLIIVDSAKGNVRSSELLIYVVDRDTNTSGLTGSKLTVKTKGDLKDKDKVLSAKVVLVDQAAVRLQEAVSLIAQLLIG